MMDREAKAHVWYHTIDLPDGTSTPGWFDTRAVPREIEWPDPIRGCRCLDVGTFDGFWAFELERRGASEVVALDLDDPAALDWAYDHRATGPPEVLRWGAERGPGFAEAARILQSNVKRIDRSVYELDPQTDGKFDLVICGALLLHLQDPIRALERMRDVCQGELLLVEALDPYLDLVAPRVPAARFAPEWDQWWRVNSAGLCRMAEIAGFELVWLGKRFLIPYGAAAADAQHMGRIHSIAARKPFARGQLHRAVRVRPRSARSG